MKNNIKWHVTKSSLNGTISIPPSKSHTIRALLIATLASGTSLIKSALIKGDGRSAINASSALGAIIVEKDGDLIIEGTGGNLNNIANYINMGNSGIGTNLFTAATALGNNACQFDGDKSLRSRPMKPLLNALTDLGAHYTLNGLNTDLPFTINGPATGGKTIVTGVTSQYLSGLLLSAPLMKNDTTIYVKKLHEKPYILITLWWLNKMNILYTVSDDFSKFTIKGSQHYGAINTSIQGDFSSATFSAVAAAITGSTVTLNNIDFTDPQGDKKIFSVLEKFGAKIIRKENCATVIAQKLTGRVVDLNNMPDALPAVAILGAYADGITRIINVKHARTKETDRIAVMCKELLKMDINITEMPDGLIIKKSLPIGTTVNGHNDHRIVMALAIAGMISKGETVIDTAESADITYPSFVDDFKLIGANITLVNNGAL